MHIPDLKIFVAVVSSGSLSAAARQLGIGPMQVSRRIAALEEELGVRLFHRTTRSVSPTAEAEALLPYANTILEAEHGVRGELGLASTEVSGVLRLTAPSVLGQTVVVPLLPSLLSQYPLLRVDLDFSDKVVDIVAQGLDLALRVATLADSELVAKRIAASPRVICAAPSYLQRRPKPAAVADLIEHECIALHAVPRWPLIVHGKLVRVPVNAKILTSSVDAARTAAMQGLGLVMLTYWDVYQQLQNGTLVSVELQDASMEDLSVWAMTPTRSYVPTRVKIFLDALKAAMSVNQGT